MNLKENRKSLDSLREKKYKVKSSILKNKKKSQDIAIFGGSFDPPHKGHFLIIKTFLKKFKVKKLILLPNRYSPFKSLKTSSEDKLKIINLFVKEIRKKIKFNKIEIEDYELKKDSPSYTYETLKYMHNVGKIKCRVSLLMGDDQFLHFKDWYNFREIAKMSNLIIFRRLGISREELTKKVKGELDLAKIKFLKNELWNISSSFIRKEFENEENEKYIKRFLFDSVYNHLFEHRIYN